MGFRDEFNTAFGTLYQSVDQFKTCVYQMNTIFCVRRLLVAFTTIFINNPLIICIYINIYSSLWIIKFYYKKKPMVSPMLNKIELINEIFQLFANYFMFLFTEFIGNVETWYSVGMWLIAYISLVFLINVSVIAASMYTDIRKERMRKDY